jgi:D-inositol-3-phosphate glycosyltransferase
LPKTNVEKIFTHYNGIGENFFPHPHEAKILKENLNIKGPVLLYIGRIAFYKGVDEIIAAYQIAKKSIPNLNLVVGGKPDFQMVKTYEVWKEQYKDIHFIGFIEDRELPYYYSMGDLFITYSYASEGFGLTPVESIACGTPVICSSMLAYKEILQDNAIFVPPKNPDQLAKEIIDLLEDDTKRENLISKAQKYIKKYTWDSVGKKVEEVYYKFMEN